MTQAGGMLISLSILYQPIHQLLYAGGAMAPSTSRPRPPLTYAVRTTGGVLISLSILYQPFHQRLFSGDGWEPAWTSRPYVEPRINRWIRRDVVDVSIYEVPMANSGSVTMATSSTSSMSISAQPASGQPEEQSIDALDDFDALSLTPDSD